MVGSIVGIRAWWGILWELGHGGEYCGNQDMTNNVGIRALGSTVGITTRRRILWELGHVKILWESGHSVG